MRYFYTVDAVGVQQPKEESPLYDEMEILVVILIKWPGTFALILNSDCMFEVYWTRLNRIISLNVLAVPA